MTERFEALGGEVVWRGRLVTAEVGRFRSPDGEEFDREIIRHPGAVNVVPVEDDGATVMMVRQYRAAVDELLLEIPAGKRDVADEPPEETAHRELAEEIGMRADRLVPLCSFLNSPGFTDELSWSFMALGLEACADDRQGPEERHATIERIALADVPELIRSGRITDGKSIIGLLLARDALAAGTGRHDIT